MNNNESNIPRNASNKRPGRFLNFLQKMGVLFEGKFNREGSVYLENLISAKHFVFLRN